MLLTFSSNSFPERFGKCGLVGVILVDMLVFFSFLFFLFVTTLWSGMGGGGTYLEMIDVDVETSLSAFGKRIGEFRVGFAQLAILRVLK